MDDQTRDIFGYNSLSSLLSKFVDSVQYWVLLLLLLLLLLLSKNRFLFKFHSSVGKMKHFL
jgi:hypothetical protein